jgi:hypothetical protein
MHVASRALVKMGNTRFPRKILFGGLAKAGGEGAREAETKGGHVIRAGYLRDGNC